MKERREGLLKCLTLIAANSMTSEDRAAWLSVACETVADMDPNEFREGCRKVREGCRFLNEIVPTIMGNAPDGAKGKTYISASGYVYRGDETEVLRTAEHRADWDTYWAMKVNANKERAN